MSVLGVPALVVFDLDGTLVDSRVDLCNSVNATLAHYGKAALPEDVIASYIGEGAGTLVRRSLAHAHVIAGEHDPHDDAFAEEALRWFIGFYKVHVLDFTYVYPGVMEALRMIRERRPEMRMAVLTNKPVMPSRRICEHFGMDAYFFANYGGNSFGTKKPEPEGLRRLMAEAGALLGREVRAEETVMVGDSHVDVETARACGAKALGCLYGLSPETLRAAGPDVLCEGAGEWVGLLVD